MTANPNYFYAPSSIRNLLVKSINDVVSNIDLYVKSPGIDFTRIRKIPADTLIQFTLFMTCKSMNSNFCDFFTLADDLPSQSAMCQRRTLLYPDASLDNSIYEKDRELNTDTIESLLDCSWIENG